MPSDSTGVESPRPHPLADSNPTTRKPSILQKLKLKQSPPIAFENQTQSRVHKRSSSFSGFVSRILPSHREEKGHALRQKYEDNGTQDPVGLVFGVSGSQDPNVRLSSEIHDGGKCDIRISILLQFSPTDLSPQVLRGRRGAGAHLKLMHQVA